MGGSASTVKGHHGAFRADKIPSLDGLRAISILTVFLSHAAAPTGRIEFGHGLGLMVPGAFGVTIFFFLSGYLITTLLRREYDAAARISLKGFYLRRLLRIFPPLYAVIALVWLLCRTSVLHYDFALPSLLAASLQAGNYWQIAYGAEALPPGTGVLWSLAVEEHFYLIFPILYFGLRRLRLDPRSQAIVLWTLCVCLMCWRLFLIFAVQADVTHLSLSTDTRFDSILFGCALAIWGNPALDPTRFSRRTWICVWVPLGLLGLAVAHVIPGPAREGVKYTIEGIALVPIFCAAVRYPRWGPIRVLNLKPVVLLGVLSYSFYLAHDVLLHILQATIVRRDINYYAVGFGICFAASWLMYVLIEKPSNRLRSTLPAARPASAADSVSGAVLPEVAKATPI